MNELVKNYPLTNRYGVVDNVRLFAKWEADGSWRAGAAINTRGIGEARGSSVDEETARRIATDAMNRFSREVELVWAAENETVRLTPTGEMAVAH